MLHRAEADPGHRSPPRLHRCPHLRHIIMCLLIFSYLGMGCAPLAQVAPPWPVALHMLKSCHTVREQLIWWCKLAGQQRVSFLRSQQQHVLDVLDGVGEI